MKKEIHSLILCICVSFPISNMPVKNITFNLGNEDRIVVTESVTHIIECFTNPIRPPAIIEWYLANESVTASASPWSDTCSGCSNDMVISRSQLSYKLIKSDQSKILKCKASNIDGYKTIESEGKQVDVQYGPSYINLSPPEQSITVKENESVGPITCTSSCKPNCANKWTGHGVKEMSDILTIHNIKRNQTGKFYCNSSNIVGNYQKEIVIDVQYNAKVINFTFLNGYSSVTEHSNTSLSCDVDGNPIPSITWYFTQQRLTTKLKTDHATTRSILSIVNSKCEDTGQYKCTADNSIFQPNTRTLELNVTCKPRIDLSCSTDNLTVIQSNTDTTLKVCWISNPVPFVVWRAVSKDNRSVPISTYRVTPILYNSEFRTNFKTEETVVYKIIARNSVGKSYPAVLTVVVNGSFLLKEKPPTHSSGERYTIIALSVVSGISISFAICVIVFMRFKKNKTNDESTSNEYIHIGPRRQIDARMYDELNRQQSGLETEKTFYENLAI